MELSDDGNLRAAISADRPETLDLLQRDSRSLERALQQAGLKADAGSLSFSLKGDGGQQHANGESGGQALGRAGSSDVLDAPDSQPPPRQSLHDGSLDITV